MRARLTVEAGDCTPSLLDLVPGVPVTLGREDGNTLVLHDAQAALRHAEILLIDQHWFLRTGSDPAAVTVLNGKRLAGRALLRDGMEIRIGAVRLRFRTAPADGPDMAALHPRELTALCHFLRGSLEGTDARPLIRRALETAVQQTRATVAGFLSLDPEAPLPRLIVPEDAPVDPKLSQTLTRQVQHRGRPVWLAAAPDRGLSGDSLAAYSDALCLPLRAADTDLGALHVYKAEGLFTERHLQFGEVLAGALSSALLALRSRRALEAENSRLRGRVPEVEQLLGQSPVMQQLRERVARAAARPVTVLIRGESGVGKELVALALHRQSPRGAGPLVVVNYAAIAPTLLEAELFGHRKGAFTGADRDRPGLFEQADGGTLFLDEIGELPLACQAKLLRAIESRVIRPVGATAEVPVDVRIIAATHRHLEREVEQGTFRQDLYFRLQVVPIVVPPLREHPEDIPELVTHYLQRLAGDSRRPLRLTEAALRRLQSYSWPGNVRQLWAVLENAATLSDGPVLTEHDLPLPPDAPGDGPSTLNLDQLETWAIRQALRRTRGNVSQAARLLGIVRDTLASKMKRKGIRRMED